MKKRRVVLSATGLPAPADTAVFALPLPEGRDGAAVRAAFAASGVSPSDARTDVILDLPSADPVAGLLLYVGAVGFLRRRPEMVTVDGTPVALGRAERTFRDQVAGQPIVAGGPAQVGAVVDGVPTVGAGPTWDDADYVAVRNADPLLWAPPAGTGPALTQLVALAALRAAPPKERFPAVVADGRTVDLDAVRKACSDLRSACVVEDRSTLVAVREPSPRAARLEAAARTDALAVLARLGADGPVCPRAERHTRPADPLIVAGTRIECSVCDPYPVDMLRVVMETTGMVADDAAAWLAEAA